MFTNLSKIPIKLGILLVGFGLLVAGCDSVGTKNKKDKTENKVEEKIAFEAVDANLADRITSVDGSSSNSVTTAAQKSAPGFSITHRIEPPGLNNTTGDEAASHLALSKNPNSSSAPRNLYVGYKKQGSEFGGGIDILDAGPTGGLSSASEAVGDAATLQSPAVDVQELGVKHNGSNFPDAIYAATAVNPDVTVPRAPQLHSIEVSPSDGLPSSDVTYDLVELLNSEGDDDPTTQPTRVAKSLVVGNGNNSGNGDVFAVSDENTAYGLPMGGNNYTIEEEDIQIIQEDQGRSYRSVTQFSGGDLYALGFSGHIYELSTFNPISSGGGSDTKVTSSPLGTISNDNSDQEAGNEDSIARLSSATLDGSEVLLAALNEGGFSVYNPGPGEVYSDPDTYATSVTATDDYVYVASGTGIAVYEVESGGLGTADAGGNNTGLEYLGKQPLADLNGGPDANDVQINDIIVDPNGSGNNILYVAKSTDGVYRLVQDVDSAWNP